MSPLSVSQADLRKAIQVHPAFGRLSAPSQAQLVNALHIEHHAQGELIFSGTALKTHLVCLLAGAAELLNASDHSCVELQPGDLFGLDQGESLMVVAARASQECVCFSLDLKAVAQLCKANTSLAYFLPPFPRGTSATPSSAPQALQGDPSLNLMTTPIQALIKRDPITLSPQTSIRDAARLMSEKRVSSVLIEENQKLYGLITDRDLRSRVVAAGADSQQPLSMIATRSPLTVSLHSPAFDALLLMARHNIHHVPVLDGERIAGMITATDLNEQQSTSAVHLVGEVHKHDTVEGLQQASAKVKRLQQSLASAQASAYSTGHMITAITDAITSRLLQMGEALLGPAPVDYVWVAAGSQARNEQTAKSDQDNCLVLDDAYDPALHGDYFKALATFVCDGLNSCGYIHCPGEIMAMTDAWRQTQSKWVDYFARWTGQPDPKSLMLTCVFFDLRAIHGNTGLLEDLRHEVLQRTKGNSIFLAYMVGNALQHEPPLGLFKGISTIRSGEHKDTIDLKHNGIVPIVDLARIYALAGGDPEVNTHDRLLSAAAGGAISEQSARDLRDALEYLAHVRIQHQARQIAAGQAPDNYLNPSEVSNFERTQLKEAFHVVEELQSVLSHRYRM